MSAVALMAQSEQRGATFLAGTRCFANHQGDDAIRLAFSFQPAEQIFVLDSGAIIALPQPCINRSQSFLHTAAFWAALAALLVVDQEAAPMFAQK